ncbi:MAG: carboxypeptidase-like regulatory domain-containing protein [Flavobacteriaceae bacterium]|nr:carboxypeptidase-like regulatory domain-containing protein [Flavobacteriaceae bacterium]MCY4267341.1 carboxypeptidase-like regulatory domain-containing protein [Flavobacteriaceae bacterium]MCY4299449.1 carboxypeptidase-like regulatory domain-containing protein [Flavobacteriaceae bacterium]
MKQLYVLLLTLILCSSGFTYCQELIQGKLLYKNVNVVAANVINNTTRDATITNSEGEFQILASLNDVIIFSSVQYVIREVPISEEILQKKRLIVAVNEDIQELNEVVVTPDQTKAFIDLVEEQFKGFDYTTDQYSRVRNELIDENQLEHGLNFVNLAKFVSRIFSNQSESQRMSLKPSQVLPTVFKTSFFENDLKIPKDHVVGFLEYLDNNMKSQELFHQDRQFQLIDFLVIESQKYLTQNK